MLSGSRPVEYHQHSNVEIDNNVNVQQPNGFQIKNHSDK
jgi:hypothetical protein